MVIKRWTGNKSRSIQIDIGKLNKKLESSKKEEFKMATQIAATPTLCGEEARKILKEVKTIPSEKAKENGQKLLNYFKKFTK